MLKIDEIKNAIFFKKALVIRYHREKQRDDIVFKPVAIVRILKELSSPLCLYGFFEDTHGYIYLTDIESAEVTETEFKINFNTWYNSDFRSKFGLEYHTIPIEFI